MMPLTELAGQTLRWGRDPESPRSYVIAGSAGLVAHLAFASSACGSLASGRTAHGQWPFKREGFLHPRITVRRAGEEVTTGVFSFSFTGSGTLALAGGAEYKMSGFGWLHRAWEFRSGDTPLLRFEQSHGEAAVEMLRADAPSDALSLLLLLGWYVPVLADEDAAAASAAAMIATM